MYKVFINESSLSFINSGLRSSNEELNYLSNFNFESLIAKLESASSPQHLSIVHPEPEIAWKDFLNYFKIIEAAGGLVQNRKGEILLIYRLGFWDLPKGKIEKNEAKEDAAIREVEEECGIEDLQILRRLKNSYHIYTHNGLRVLKPTYWYEMKTSFSGQLIPQLEEDITKAKWIDKNDLKNYISKTYASIAELINSYLNLN